MAITESTAITSTAGFQTIELTEPVYAQEDQTIWLAWVFENNPGIRYTSGSPGRAASGQSWASGMPEEFLSSTPASYVYSICANYTPVEQEQVELLGNPYMYTARRYDIETGLYYYRARYYNPYIGRFLQKDPAGQGMNMYAYCGNNSLNCVDPMGLYFITIDIPLAEIYEQAGTHNAMGEYIGLDHDLHRNAIAFFLGDTGLGSIGSPYAGILVETATYHPEPDEFNGYYTVTFYIPDELDIEFSIGQIDGIDVMFLLDNKLLKLTDLCRE